MRKTIASALLFSAVGCTVQVGRNPENTFEVDTDLAGSVKDPPPETPSPDGRKPDSSATPPEEQAVAGGINRNWRVGAENTRPEGGNDPAARYADLFSLFRADHHEAVRLAEQDKRARGVLFANRAARRLREMGALLSDEAAEPFARIKERYTSFAGDMETLEGTFLRTRAQAIEADLLRSFSPESARLKTVPTPKAQE